MISETISRPETPLVHQRSLGRGEFGVKYVAGESRIARFYQQGCLKLRTPHSSSGLQAIMINSSGGMTGGDRLDWRFELEEKAALTVTSQACERVYASSRDVARTDVSLSLGDDARLAWLPQETLVFDKGAFARQITVEMGRKSQLLMVEPVIFGRTAMREVVTQGCFHDRWRVRKSGRLIHAEDMRLDGTIADILAKRPVTHGLVAMATVLMIAPGAEGLLEDARQIIGDGGDASFWNEKLVARLVAADGYTLRQKLVPLINLLNNGTPVPKVWML